MARIGLLDVDGHRFPNLALMKLSAYHKQQGDEVETLNALFQYDKVYTSKVFTFTPDFETCIQADEIIKGGTGYDLKNKLPDHIEHIYPDYGFYGINNTAYGFLTRGCPRACDFCIVSEKEGCCSKKVANLNEFWKGQKEIKLLDPNILASKDHEDLLKQLADSRAWVDFTQGLDARLLNDDRTDLIKRIKVKRVHFAWDDPNDTKTPKKLRRFKERTGLERRKTAVYVLTNFNSSFEQDLERLYKLREMDYDPYVMIYEKQTAPRNIRLLQRWVNNKIIWRSCDRFEDYDPRKG